MEFLMVMILWCGSPSYNRMNSGWVNECRERLWKCYQTKTKWNEKDFYDQCLKNEKLTSG